MQSVSDYNANTRYFTPNILKYPGIAGQADIVSRESVKFPAIGSNFSSNNPTKRGVFLLNSTKRAEYQNLFYYLLSDRLNDQCEG